MAKSKTDMVMEKLSQHDGQLSTIASDVEKIKLVVTGNGGEGHEQRLKELEVWKAEHPHKCPLEHRTREILARRAIDATFIGVAVGLILWLLDHLHIFGG